MDEVRAIRHATVLVVVDDVSDPSYCRDISPYETDPLLVDLCQSLFQD